MGRKRFDAGDEGSWTSRCDARSDSRTPPSLFLHATLHRVSAPSPQRCRLLPHKRACTSTPRSTLAVDECRRLTKNLLDSCGDMLALVIGRAAPLRVENNLT